MKTTITQVGTKGAGRPAGARRACPARAAGGRCWLPTLLALLAVTVPARADRPGDDPPPSCLDEVTASFYAMPSTVVLGRNTTLHWNVQVNGCAGVTQSIGSASVPPIASRVETPTSTRAWTLTVRQGGATRSWTVP